MERRIAFDLDETLGVPRIAENTDVRKLRLEYLIDDSPEHREEAGKYGLADRYIVAPAFGG